MKGTTRSQTDCTTERHLCVMLRLSWIMAAFLMPSLLLTSCSSASIGTESHIDRIALITPVGSKSVSDAVRFGAESAARELGVELITVEMTTTARDTLQEHGAVKESSNTKETGNSDSATRVAYTDRIHATHVDLQTKAEEQSAQASAVAHALKQGATAIILNPVSDHGVEQSIHDTAMTGQKGEVIPVISLDAEQVNGVTSSISMDHRAAGRQAGQAIGELLEGRGRILLLGTAQNIDQNTDQNVYQSTSPNHYALVERERGVREILQQQYPQLQVESRRSCQDEPSCQLHMEQWLQVQYAKLDQQNVDSQAQSAGHVGVIALDEVASMVAARSVVKYGSSRNNIPIVGFGSEREQLEQLQEGVIRRLIVHNGFSAGYLGVQQAIAYLNGEQVQPRIILETRVVSTENMFWMDNQKLLFPFVQ